MIERLELAYGRIAQIPEEALVPEPFREYFVKVASFLLTVRKDADNRVMYEDILPENYGRSYANPDAASEKLGSGYGPVLSAVYAELRGVIPSVFEDDEEGVATFLELFLEIYGLFADDELPSADSIRNVFRSYCEDYLYDFLAERIRGRVDPDDCFAANIIMNADLSGPEYLMRYGEYVTDDTIAVAAYINSLPEDTVRKMAHIFTEGYRLAFVSTGIDLSVKRTVQIVYELGFERMIRYAIREFADMGLRPTILRSPVRLVTKSSDRKSGYKGAIPNMQFDYDHRNDIGLFLGDEFVSKQLRAMQEAYESVKDLARVHAGPAIVETFGEEPYAPAACEHAIALSRDQQEKSTQMRNESARISNRYIASGECSFTMIYFPAPSIGEDFKDIFNEVMHPNTHDNELYRGIQKKLADALDLGCAVRVRGAGGSPTDITVAFCDLHDSVGEAFISPKHERTDGLMNLESD